jgi:hypothetical protein
MSLFQVTIKRDHDWETINELFKLTTVHYIDINSHIQAHQLLFADVLRRADESQKKITYLEEVLAQYQVKVVAPKNLQEFELAIKNIEQAKRKSPNQLFPEVELELTKQERFVRE